MKNATPYYVCACLLSLSSVTLAQRTATAPFQLWLNEVAIPSNGGFINGLAATEEQLAADPPLFLAGNPLLLPEAENLPPLLFPDGVTQATYNDLAGITGTMHLTELGEAGTQINISVEGLIPNGVYSAYSDVYAAPGFTPDFVNSIGGGALGYPTDAPPADPFDYVGNVFTADADGRAVLEVIQTPVAPSWVDTWAETNPIPGFEFPPYVLDPPVGEFSVLLNYHVDGTASGPRPSMLEGAAAFDSTWLGYSFAVLVVPEPSSLSLSLGCLLLPLLSRRSRT